jgi:hypothetical protein
MTLGALPTAVVVWIAIFWPVRGAIAEYQHVRHRRIRRKVRARLAKQEANRLAERLRVAAAASRDKEEA